MYHINHMPSVIELGHIGETAFRAIEIDMSPWLGIIPGGVASILCVRPGETQNDAYIAASVLDGKILRWTPVLSDLGSVEGYGEIQIRIGSGDQIGKTVRVKTLIRGSIGGPSGVIPAVQQPWMDQMTSMKDQVTQMALATRDWEMQSELYAENALSAQAAAEAARDAAQAAAGDFQGLSATATGLEAGADPTINVTHSADGLYNLAFGIPKGDRGIQGLRGERGYKGDTGDTPDIAIGTVSTLPAGSSASASMSGTAKNPLLNLSIPRGDKGETGDPAPSSEVTPAVNAYLAENFSNPSNPPLDRTLSSDASAAPADMVGNLKSAVNKASQVTYKTDISSATGLIPFHAKNGDSITIKTKNGSNFASDDQLRFYDENGTYINYWGTTPQTVNYRTFTYTLATEARYIGITQVASSVIDYVVVNNNSIYNLEQPIVNLQDALKYQETRTIKLESGTFTDATGTVKTENTARCRNVTPIPLEDFVSLAMPDGYSMYIFLLDYNLQKLGVLTWSTYRTKLDLGNAAYINIAIRNTSSPSSSVTDSISTIESGIVFTNNFSQLQTQVESVKNDLYEQTVILSDAALHAFPINNGTTIVITTADGTTLPEGNPYLQCYDKNGAYMDQFLCSSDYGNARTVTVSFGNVASVKMYAVPSKSIKVYIPDKSKLIPKVEEIAKAVGQSLIIVDASGSGDYTSFTEAIYETVDSGIDVYVKPGTYNIVSEYVALFGQSAVDSMADADSETFDGFQYGVRLRNRRVEFAPGAHLVCNWTGHTVNGTHRFSALGVDYNVEIIGLDLDVTATFYCIHDDYGISTPYTVKYENCRVVGHSIVNANCIGGGCKKYSRHILKNCYFDNNLTGSATVRYHNTNADGAEPEIYVSDCYFNNWFTPRWYGTQTSKMRVYVNNCHARAIYKIAESSSYNVDNVELYKWNNEETDPRD